MSFAEYLPHANATLNGSSAICLLCGLWAIKSKKDRKVHRRFMLTALWLSAIFLVSYLTRVAITGHTYFPGHDWVHTLYLCILGTHTLAAGVALPLVLRTLYLALKERFPEHRKWARWTYPIWLYVSVTGVVVYWMLYHLRPPAAWQ